MEGLQPVPSGGEWDSCPRRSVAWLCWKEAEDFRSLLGTHLLGLHNHELPFLEWGSLTTGDAETPLPGCGALWARASLHSLASVGWPSGRMPL